MTPLLLLLWGRLHRTILCFIRLVNAVDAGRVRPKPARPPAARERKLQPRLPEGFGWLGKLVPQTRVLGCQLQHLLTDPRMTELLQADPRAGRLLRPLCRMLGVPLPATLARPRPALPQPAPPQRTVEPPFHEPPADEPPPSGGTPRPSSQPSTRA